MNKKNIQRHLSKKIDKWCESITDKELVRDIKKDIVVTGGCIPSLLTGDEIHDYDVYFKTKSTTLKVAQYYVKEWKKTHEKQDIHVFESQIDYESYIGRKVKELIIKKDIDVDEAEDLVKTDVGCYYDDRVTIFVPSSGVVGEVVDYHDMSNFEANRGYNKDNITTIDNEKNSESYDPIFMSSNAITLSDGIQIIVRFYGEPKEIHKNFDFIHATGYFADGKLHTTTDILEAIMNKELIYRGSKYPLCSIVRLRKFIKRGWTISAGQILKIALNLQDFDLTYIETMKDQLIGVDSLYFRWLINIIQHDLKNGTISDIDSAYVAELVDKIF